MSIFKRNKIRKDSLISLQVKRGTSIVAQPDFSIIGTNDGFLLKFIFKSLTMTDEVQTTFSSIEFLLKASESTFWVSGNPNIQLWTFKLEHLATFQGHNDVVIGLGVLNGILISASEDKSVRIWDMKTKQSTELYSHQSPVISFAFDSDRGLISSSCSEKILILYAPLINEVKAKITVSDNIWCMQFLNSNHLATGDHNCMIIIRDLRDLKETKRIKVHDSRVKCLALNHNGTLLASGGFDQRICVVDTQDFYLIKSFEGQSDWVRAVAFDSFDNVLSVSDDKYITIWNYKQSSDALNWKVISLVIGAVLLIAGLTGLCGFIVSF